jgi:hypothetical protein
LTTKTIIYIAINKTKPVNQFTLDGPTPTNISRNSEPETVINGTLASPAVALASNVFPVPGGPGDRFNTPLALQVAQLHTAKISARDKTDKCTKNKFPNKSELYIEKLISFVHTKFSTPNLLRVFECAVS